MQEQQLDSRLAIAVFAEKLKLGQAVQNEWLIFATVIGEAQMQIDAQRMRGSLWHT